MPNLIQLSLSELENLSLEELEGLPLMSDQPIIGTVTSAEDPNFSDTFTIPNHPKENAEAVCVGVCVRGGSSEPVSATYGGQAMTLQSLQGDSGEAGFVWSAVFTIDGSALDSVAATADVVVTMAAAASSKSGGAANWTNLHPTNLYGSPFTNFGESLEPSLDVTLNNHQALFTQCGVRHNIANFAFDEGTLLWDEYSSEATTGNRANSFGQSYHGASATLTASYTSIARTWAWIALPLNGPPPAALCVTETNTLGAIEITNIHLSSDVPVDVTETHFRVFGSNTVELASKTNQEIADEIAALSSGGLFTAVVTDAYSPSATNTLQPWSGTTIAANGGTAQLPGDLECGDDGNLLPGVLFPQTFDIAGVWDIPGATIHI